MTEVAFVFGIAPGTVCVGTASSSESRVLATRRCDRRGRGVALELSSASARAAADDFALVFALRGGTPVGRMAFEFSSSGEMFVGSAAKPEIANTIAKPAKRRRDQRRFMRRQISDKGSTRASCSYQSCPR